MEKKRDKNPFEKYFNYGSKLAKDELEAVVTSWIITNGYFYTKDIKKFFKQITNNCSVMERHFKPPKDYSGPHPYIK